jgi:glycosyltransferase involved in cell wall biosynthesis
MIARLSCIVPCRNAQDYLAQAIASALAEGADEVVIVDDGSTDDSAAVAAAAVGPVRILRQAEQGAAAARNAGLAVARHHLIAFLDADDLWPTGSLALLRSVLGADANLDAVYGHTRQFYSPELDVITRSRLACPPGSLPAPTFGSILLRRSVFERIGGFNATLKVGEMFEFMTRFADAGLGITCVPETVLLRRIHASNTMRPDGAAVNGYPRALKAVLDRRRRMRPANERGHA